MMGHDPSDDHVFFVAAFQPRKIIPQGLVNIQDAFFVKPHDCQGRRCHFRHRSKVIEIREIDRVTGIIGMTAKCLFVDNTTVFCNHHLASGCCTYLYHIIGNRPDIFKTIRTHAYPLWHTISHPLQRRRGKSLSRRENGTCRNR